MNFLITGGAGFIGSHLAEALISRGDRVIVYDNLSTGRLINLKAIIRNQNLAFIKGDILDKRRLGEAAGKVDIIFHLAAVVGVKYVLEHPLRTLEVNVTGTENILSLARRFRKKVVLASSSEVYGKSENFPLKEDDDRILGATSITRWSYAATKAMDEFMALAYAREKKLAVLIVRFFNICGPRQTGRYGMVIPRLVEEALRGKPLTVYGDGKQTRSFTYVADAVRAVLALSLRREAYGQIFNLGSHEVVSIEELALKIKEMTGSSSPLVYIPYEEAYGRDFEDMRHRRPDISKLEKFLGAMPETKLEDIISSTIKYMKGKL
jgi:UDP-glucose 4-epimerase